MSEPTAIVVRPADEPGSGSVEAAETEIQLLEADIALKRERVVASFGELRRRVDGATDWRQWVRAHPVAWIATAVSVGFLFGYRRGGGPR